jgi:tetratricopeptide (TPR) repeat protein
LESCENALLVGEADEFAIRQRVAVIHQSNNRLSEALDAYIAARALRRGDEAVAQAIVALVDSSGRKDAGALAARGTSLLTLGRAADALSALRQAQTLAPGFPEIAAAIATAERQVRMDEQMESRRRAATVVEQAPPPNTAAQIAAVPERRYSNAATASRSH